MIQGKHWHPKVLRFVYDGGLWHNFSYGDCCCSEGDGRRLIRWTAVRNVSVQYWWGKFDWENKYQGYGNAFSPALHFVKEYEDRYTDDWFLILIETNAQLVNSRPQSVQIV